MMSVNLLVLDLVSCVLCLESKTRYLFREQQKSNGVVKTPRIRTYAPQYRTASQDITILADTKHLPQLEICE